MAAAMGAALFISPVKAEPSKTIATLDITRITSESKAAKDINAQIEDIRKQFEASVKTHEAKLQALEKDLVKQQANLSPEAYERMRTGFEKQVGDLHASIGEEQQRIGTAAQAAMESLRKEVIKISEATAKDRYSLVLPSTVPVVALGDDITNEVIAALDKKMPKIALGVNKVNITMNKKALKKEDNKAKA